MDLTDSSRVGLTKTFLHWASIKVENQERSKVRKLSWQSNDKCIFEVKLFQFLAFAYLDWHLSQRVVIQPQLLQIRKLPNLWAELDNIIVT